MDQPLYTTESRSQLSEEGMTAYQSFLSAIVLDQIIRQAGDDPEQKCFHSLFISSWLSELFATEDRACAR